MNKMHKFLALITGAAISIGGMVSGLKAEAILPSDYLDYFEVTDLNSTPNEKEFEEFRNTELYNKYKSYFSALGPYIYRSKTYPTVFYYYDAVGFNEVKLDIYGQDERWIEIYNKYKDKLNWDEPSIYKNMGGIAYSAYIGDGVITSSDLPSNWDGISENSESLDFSADVDFSDIEAEAQELYETVPGKYPIIMEMIAEMKEANCINNATFIPFSVDVKLIITENIKIYDYKGTEEEIKELVRSEIHGGAPTITFWSDSDPNDQNDGAYVSISFLNENYTDGITSWEEAMQTGGTAEDYFALYEKLKSMEKEMGFKTELIHSLYDYGLDDATAVESIGKKIDCFKVIDSAGDVNIDGRLGIQDIIALNKNIAELITFNDDQLMAADMNYDRCINSDDLNILMHRIVD